MKILLLVAAAITTFLSHAQTDSELKVDMRRFGHEILQASGDSTTRVLPIEREFNRYHLHFEESFSFDPATIVAFAQEIFNQRKPDCHYIVEVVTCEEKLVVYSFESKPSFNQELVPCRGRIQPKGCYSIQVTFLNLNESRQNGNQQYANNESSMVDKRNKLIVLLIFGGIVLVVFLGFWLRKKPDAQAPHEPKSISFGSFEFVPAVGKLHNGATTFELTGKESKLLELLALKVNQTVDRATLLKDVWEDEKGDYIGRTLDVYISKLRKKLSLDPNVSIINERGVGYSLVVE